MKTEYQVQQEYTDELIKLQLENPNARVMCFVSDECTNGDYSYQSSEMGKPRLEKMTLINEHWYTNDDEDEIMEHLWEEFDCEDHDDLSDQEKEDTVEDRFENYKYEEIVVIYIEPM